MQSTQNLREKLQHTTAVGPFSKTSDPAFIEVMGLAGLDFVILDLEHGSNDGGSLGNLIRAAHLSNIAPIVRVKNVAQVGTALDLGAAGVQCPHVCTAEDAAKLVREARFAPQGNRGVCRYVRAAGYGTQTPSEYFVEANRALVIAQVEGREGLRNLEEILAVDGLDVIFVGVYDLSQSLGMTGEVNRPEILAALEDVTRTCGKSKIAVGTFVENESELLKRADLGVRYLCYSVDVGLFSQACRRVVDCLGEQGTAVEGKAVSTFSNLK